MIRMGGSFLCVCFSSFLLVFVVVVVHFLFSPFFLDSLTEK